jgi:hypothetical protein
MNRPTVQPASIPHLAKVRAHGFVMLRGVDDGRTYQVKRDEARKVYWFCTPRSGRKLVGHHISSVDGMLRTFQRGDNNGIEVIHVEPEVVA